MQSKITLFSGLFGTPRHGEQRERGIVSSMASCDNLIADNVGSVHKIWVGFSRAADPRFPCSIGMWQPGITKRERRVVKRLARLATSRRIGSRLPDDRISIGSTSMFVIMIAYAPNENAAGGGKGKPSESQPSKAQKL